MRTLTFTFSTVGNPARTLTEGCHLPLAGWQRERFRYSLLCAWRDGAICRGARDLGRLLVRQLGDDGQLDPSRETLARGNRCSIKSVDRHLDQLKGAALVDWDQRFQVRPMAPVEWNGGSQIEARSNQYRLNPQPYSSMKSRAKKRRSERQIDAQTFVLAPQEKEAREQEEGGGACAAGAATEIRNEVEDATEVELPIVEVTSTCRAVVPQVPRAPWVSIRGTLTEEAYASVSRDRQRWHLARMAEQEAREAARLRLEAPPALPLPPPHPEADVEPLTRQEIHCLSLAEIGARRLATIFGRPWRRGD